MTRKRKNPNPPRNERKVVERGYFHTGNSGITVSMIEEFHNYDWDEHDRDFFNHTLEIRHSAFGAPSTFQTPIAGPLMCDYYIEAFERLKQRMLANPRYSVYRAFDRYDHRKPTNDAHRIVGIADGLERKEVYGAEMVTGPNSTEKRLFGYIYCDDDGKPVRADPAPDGSELSSGACGSDSSGPRYSADEIGKPVRAERNEEEEERNYATVEELGCVLAKSFKNVGFMAGPVCLSRFNPKVTVAARAFKMPVPVEDYITADVMAEAIMGRLTDTDDDIHIYEIREICTPEGPRMSPETMEPEGWFPAERFLMVRVGIADDGKLNPTTL